MTNNQTKEVIKIVLATRTDNNNYEDCIKELKERFKNDPKNDFNIEKIYVICDLHKENIKINNINCEILYDLKPTRPTVFNKVIEKLNKEKNDQCHLLTFSKEVEFNNKHITEMVKNLRDKYIVVGYRLKDNITSEKDIKLYINGDPQKGNIGIAYRVPWNTCALWNKEFVYGEDNSKLIFDEMCESKNNQLGHLNVKVHNILMETEYEGMEDGLAIAELITNNKDKKLKYKLIEEELFWNITGGDKRIEKQKIKLARKNIVLSTFMNIKGYSIDKLIEAGRD